MFAEHYKRLCEQVINGVTLPLPDAPALPQETETPLTPEENLRRLQALRSELDL